MDRMMVLIDILRNSILITGLVIIMMMMIESLNIESKGKFFSRVTRSRFGQVVFSALLGSIPGCMGGFASVSLYTHRMLSFGALVAMMIASSGDEAFIMLAMIPDKALPIFAILIVIAVAAGLLTDFIRDRYHKSHCSKSDHSSCGTEASCSDGYTIHTECDSAHQKKEKAVTRHYGWKRIVMFIGLAVFIVALVTGAIGHDHEAHSHVHDHECHENCIHENEGIHIDILSEEWMNIIFAGLSIIMLIVLVTASDHFIEEHLWNHIIRKHLPTIFAWTFGVLLIVTIGLQFINIEEWINSNTALMILLATLIGIIPESGPHIIFVTLYAAGIVPLPVLLASCISQDGHSSLPLIAESRKSFIQAKLVNCIVALLAGYISMWIL